MWTLMDSPVGELRIVAHRGELTRIDFEPFTTPADGSPLGERDDELPVLVETREQLTAYFTGERHEFDLPLAPRGTDFQQRVWRELQGIGWGQRSSYGALALRLGRTPAASRAVGLANGKNPIPIVIPCHRVVGADGKLVGYAGGLSRKQTLLDLESEVLFGA